MHTPCSTIKNSALYNNTRTCSLNPDKEADKMCNDIHNMYLTNCKAQGYLRHCSVSVWMHR